VRAREDKKKQYNLYQKVTKPHISHIWGEAPAERIELTICTDVDLWDVIMKVKFKFEKFQGF